MRIQLLVLNEGPMKGKAVKLPVREFLIGRDPACHLRPNSGLVAPRHCMVRVFGPSVSVEDLGGAAGTTVNGERIRGQVELRVGDRIGVGPLLFEVSVEKPAPARQIVEPTDEGAAAMLLDDGDAEAACQGPGDSKAPQ